LFFYIFVEKKHIECSEDNVFQTRAQVNKFNMNESYEKEKSQTNTLGATKKQLVVN
jgi:hypothetical protein